MLSLWFLLGSGGKYHTAHVNCLAKEAALNTFYNCQGSGINTESILKWHTCYHALGNKYNTPILDECHPTVQYTILKGS